MRQTARFTLLVLLALVAAPASAVAQRPPLQLFKNYFLAGGDYVVGGIGLRGQGVTDPVTGKSMATGSIGLSGVPADADIAAAFLYWMTIEQLANTEPASADGFFRGQPIVGQEITPPGAAVPACRGSGGGSGTTSETTILRVYRTDVLRLLPVDQLSGRVQVNGSHSVSLPDSGSGGSQSPSSGNQATYLEGTSLVVVYRRPTQNLRAVVIYDGSVTADQDFPRFELTMGGYYDPAANPNARLAFLVGDGRIDWPETVTINGQVDANPNPFYGKEGSSWDNPTYSVPGTLGDSLNTSVQSPTSSIDCLSYAATILSTEVKDTDRDGIPNKVEDTVGGLTDAATGQTLPDLKGMGASSAVPDLFVEMDYMTSGGWGTVGPHNHRPSPKALEMVATAFKNAGINVHFDVGNEFPPANWIISTGTEGGQAIPETACGDYGTNDCQFPDYPGTVGWKSGFQYFRDANFNPNRKDFVHYVLWAHALGLPRCSFDSFGELVCNEHVPTRSSGFGDVGGGDVLISLGAFKFVRDGKETYNGSDVVQAGTLMHELGHNLELRHGGFESGPNCKPNYQSVMSYLFQVHGLVGASGALEVNFSGQQLGTLNEEALYDAALTPAAKYPTRWYALEATSVFRKAGLNITPTSKRCDGSFAGNDLPMLRVDGRSATDKIDWANDGRIDTGLVSSPGDPRDINYDGQPETALVGFDDWSRVKGYGLLQVGSRPNEGSFSLDVGIGEGRGDPGRGDPGRGDPGRGDPGRGDPGRGDPGRGDPGRGDPGVPPGDLDFETATAIANGPYGLVATIVNTKTVMLTWQKPYLVAEDAAGVPIDVAFYEVYKVPGTALTDANYASVVKVCGQAPAVACGADPQATVAYDYSAQTAKQYTYFVLAQFTNAERSQISNPQTVGKK